MEGCWHWSRKAMKQLMSKVEVAHGWWTATVFRWSAGWGCDVDLPAYMCVMLSCKILTCTSIGIWDYAKWSSFAGRHEFVSSTNSSIPRFGWIHVKCCLGCTTYDHFSGLAFSGISSWKIGVLKRGLCLDVDPVRWLPGCKCTHESDHDSLFTCCCVIEYFFENLQSKKYNFERCTHWSLVDHKQRWSSVPMLCAWFVSISIEAMKTYCRLSNTSGAAEGGGRSFGHRRPSWTSGFIKPAAVLRSMASRQRRTIF